MGWRVVDPAAMRDDGRDSCANRECYKSTQLSGGRHACRDFVIGCQEKGKFRCLRFEGKRWTDLLLP